MTAAEAMTARLPSLYRPDQDEQPTPLVALLAAVGAAVDRGDTDAALALQAHWFATADLAALDPYQQRLLALFTDPPPAPGFLVDHQVIRDLARIGSLLGVSPWPDAFPAETVEGYRRRIRRTVGLYERGVGTVDAIRRMVEAQLPRDEALGPKQADLGFGVQEAPPLTAAAFSPVRATGPTAAQPAELLGPLMHWELLNDGLEPAPPEVIVEGVEPGPGVDATDGPLVERYAGPGPLHGAGLGYRGTVPAGQALRLRPAFSSYLGTDAGVLRADALPAEQQDADPTADGPWQPSATGDPPTGAVVALARTDDAWLWALDVDTGADVGRLRRFDGRAWAAVGDPIPGAQTLAADGAGLLIGTATGLLRLPAPGAADDNLVPVAGVSADVRALLGYAGGVLIGTSDGAQLLAPDGTVTSLGPGAGPDTRTQVTALAAETSGILYLGGPLGLFQFQPALGHWYRFAGGQPDELADDWMPFDPASGPLPTDAEVFLPAVTAIHRGPGADLWLGTEAGLARYRARSSGRLAYSTALEAFPDICPDPVHAILADARGGLWFGTGRGLLRFDGRDLWQWRSDSWVQLGRADTRYPSSAAQSARGRYRYDRAGSTWQRLDDGEQPAPDGQWPVDTDAPPTTADEPDEPAVLSIAVVDAVVADLLAGYDRTDGSFSHATRVDAANLVVRFKPRPDLVVDGGIPALPRLPVGTSTWRYLRLEDGPQAATGRTWWTCEGRRVARGAGPDGLALLPESALLDLDTPPPASEFDAAVFSYPPAARVRMRWRTRQPLDVLVRLRTRQPGGTIDPAVLGRLADSVRAGTSGRSAGGVRRQRRPRAMRHGGKV